MILLYSTPAHLVDILLLLCFVIHVQLSTHVFDELLDSIIIDVASECHRVAKLGLDHNLEEEEEELRLSAQARASVADPSNSSETNGKYIVDIFGQTHPPVANEVFECMNCGRSIMAGRFAPHLEKCMGKVYSFLFQYPFSNYLSSVHPNYSVNTSMQYASGEEGPS